jgi:hypothetical protein
LWECHFCDPSRTVYKLAVPPAHETERMFFVKRLIKEHVELHQKDLLSKMMSDKDYEFVCKENSSLIADCILTKIQFRLEQKVSKEFDNGFMEQFQSVNSIKIIHFKIKLF